MFRVKLKALNRRHGVLEFWQVAQAFMSDLSNFYILHDSYVCLLMKSSSTMKSLRKLRLS